jgi:O-antigen/teichoic acid export membrane protein
VSLETPPNPDRAAADPLSGPNAGGQAVRGGILRALGYVVGRLLALISAPLLLRHLGVADFGGYAAVTSLITIAALFSDAGLTIIGIREYAVRDEEGRERLMGAMLSLRLGFALCGALAATVFAVVAGYSNALVLGTALAGVGLVLFFVQQAFTVPLFAQMRLGFVTALELLRQALTAVFTVALVIVGASVTAFLAVSIPVGLIVAAVTLVSIRGHVATRRPGINMPEIRFLFREVLAIGGASILASLFYRIAIVVMSVMSTTTQTGYFAASYRVIEVIIPLPSLINSAAFPVLSRAATDSPRRLAQGVRQIFDINLILGCGGALLVWLGAAPIIAFLGGDAFKPAVSVLQIQAFAVVATFVFAGFSGALVAIRGQRGLFRAALVGCVLALVLSCLLVPIGGATGAAIAMTVSETVLAFAAGVALLRHRPQLRPRLTIVAKVLAALAPGVAAALMGLETELLLPLATVAYVGVLVALRAVPSVAIDALVGAFRAGARSR